MLPLFAENSKSPAMLAHAIDLIKNTVTYLNPGQAAVIAVDQPLFALAKSIQWAWPAEYGQDKVVFIMGGLHIEMTMLKLLGDFLEGSGWMEAIVKAEIAHSGTAESFIKGSHVGKTRHAHQITSCALQALLSRAFNAHKETSSDGEITFNEWNSKRIESHPQHRFWWTVLQLQLLLLCLVKSFRQLDFGLYKDCLARIAGWCFALDHVHYARWMSIHYSDMINLDKVNPEIEKALADGKFAVSKTRRKFSAIPIDHAHEQNNSWVKGDGGAIGLMTNERALQRWMMAGPELARMVEEFQECRKDVSDDTRHHEQRPAVQATFLKQVQALTTTMEEMGNPFTEESHDLIQLDSKDIVDADVAKVLQSIEKTGEKQFQEFISNRLENQAMHVLDPIKKNKLHIFTGTPHHISKSKNQVALLKSDCSLFSRLFIACQTRDGNLHDFFQHENQPFPPSLSQNGNLRSGSKSDLLDCLVIPRDNDQRPDIQVLIMDGASIVHMMKPSNGFTFNDYAKRIFIPHIESKLEKVERLDVVWDTYKENSLKASTRQERGKGIRRKVDGTNKTPTNWAQFLRVDQNKVELYKFLAHELLQVESPKQIITTIDDRAVCLHDAPSVNLSPCNHEEADSRLLLHCADAVSQGFESICIRTVDTDVVVIAMTVFKKLGVAQLWVAFGTGKNFTYVPIHEIVESITVPKAQVLALFHSFSGCDTVSSFSGIGKKRAWEAWRIYPEVTGIFQSLIDNPSEISDAQMAVIEKFTILMYDKTSDISDIHESRKYLFAVRGRAIENIPPTRASLLQHLKRAIYQACYIWCQALTPVISLPSPSDWGWQMQGRWMPFWTTLPEVCKASRQLIRCSCVKGCRGNCKCNKAVLKCTALCNCGGECSD